MQLLQYYYQKYQLWRLRDTIDNIKTNPLELTPPSLILKVLDTIWKPGLIDYRSKQGYRIYVDSGYSNIMLLFNNLDLVIKAVQDDNITSVNSILIKRTSTPIFLIDYLVDIENNIIAITTIEVQLRNRLSILNAIIVATVDPDQRLYFLRKLSNILREMLVVTEALLKAADLTCQPSPIRKLLKF